MHFQRVATPASPVESWTVLGRGKAIAVPHKPR
jgi:hypothetical protein